MKKRSLVHRFLLLVLVKIPVAFLVLTFLWVLILKWIPPIATPLMAFRAIEFHSDKDFHTRYKWVNYEHISSAMARAVIAAEDQYYFEHHGFDKKAIRDAIREHREGKQLRGASTISQQTAKNVFCSHRHDFVRKAFETYFTVLIEWLWGKERILEVYLNIAELGKGIYGVQAAADSYWKESAAEITLNQAYLLAACLPSPLNRSPLVPDGHVMVKAHFISTHIDNLSYPDWIYHK